MRKPVAVLVLWIAAAGVAVAQTPTTESVTVTQTREAIAKFIQTFAKPTRLTGKLARWETPICPVTMGVKDAANEFVMRRVREVAAEVGARVDAREKCKPNIEVFFTKAPQALMEDIRQNYSGYIGYYDNRDERDRLTTFAHPIQALYSTATRDLRGQINIDTGMRRGGRGVTIILPCAMTGDGLAGGTIAPPGAGGVPIMSPKLCTRYMPNAIKANVTGSRIGDGLRSSFEHVIIVVDPRLVAGQELGAVSDYIALLALTQITPPDGCVSLPSIANLLAPGCGEPVKGLTPGDTAYLRGLYRMDASAFLGGQKSAISWEMEQALGERE
jgi:hypothetical protein